MQLQLQGGGWVMTKTAGVKYSLENGLNTD